MTNSRIYTAIVTAKQYINDLVLPSLSDHFKDTEYTYNNDIVKYLKEEFDSISTYCDKIAFLTVLVAGSFTNNNIYVANDFYMPATKECIELYKIMERTFKKHYRIFLRFYNEYEPHDPHDIMIESEWIDFFNFKTIRRKYYDVEGFQYEKRYN